MRHAPQCPVQLLQPAQPVGERYPAQQLSRRHDGRGLDEALAVEEAVPNREVLAGRLAGPGQPPGYHQKKTPSEPEEPCDVMTYGVLAGKVSP